MGYTLGYYFNTNDQGPNSAYAGLVAAKAQILENIKNTKKVQNIGALEARMNSFFYPKEDDAKGKNALKNFNELLTDAFWGGWETSGAKSRIGVSIETEIGSKGMPRRKQGRAYANALQAGSKKIKEKYAEVLDEMANGNLPALNQLMNEIDTDVDSALNLIAEIADSIGAEIGNRTITGGIAGNKQYKQKSITLESERGFWVGKTRYNRKYIEQIVNAMDEILLVIGKEFYFTKDDVGDIFEYAVALFNSDLKKAKEMGAAELKEELLNTTLKGKKQGARSYGLIEMKDEVVLSTEKVIDKKGHEHQVYKFGPIELEHYSNLTSIDETFSKADVTLKGEIGASLKNWSGLTYEEKDKSGNVLTRRKGFGTTSLLRAIARTSNALEQYAWAMQTPHGKVSGYDPTSLVQFSHYFARMAIYADILMGLGFQSTDYHAGTIIINDRAAKHITIFNAADEILKALDNEKRAKIAIEDYDEETIRKGALDIMAEVKSNIHSARTSNYSTVMQDFLNGKKVRVVYTGN